MADIADQPVIAFATVDECRAWFEVHHDSSGGFWLKIGKGRLAGTTVSYPEALDIAICFGWIDGQKRSLDDGYWLQRFTARTSRSKWSKINCAKAEALIASGAMRPAGLREVERAKSDGRWDAAYAGQATAVVPDDLRDALAADDRARAFFETLSGVNRYAILHRIQDAKKPDTRVRRIDKFVAMCHNHETIYP